MKQIKLYNRLGVFKDNINPKLLIGDITFDNDINAGQGTLNLKLALNYHTDIFLQGDVIEIRDFSEDHPNGTEFYTGYIENVYRSETVAGQEVTVKVVGLFQLLNNFIYKDGSSIDFTKTDTPNNIIKDIIDQFNTNYGVFNASGPKSIASTEVLRYTTESIPDIVQSNISVDFSESNMLTAINSVQDGLEYYFYIDNTGLVTFKENRVEANKKLTFQKDILNITQTDTQNDLVNRLYLKRSDGTVKIYEDTGSIGIYGLKEGYVSNTSLGDEATQDIYGGTYLSENSDIKQQITITTKLGVDIIPGDNIKTLNSINNINNLQVVKVSRGATKKIVYLDDYTGIGATILNN